MQIPGSIQRFLKGLGPYQSLSILAVPWRRNKTSFVASAVTQIANRRPLKLFLQAFIVVQLFICTTNL
jgi:hypothetical protein